ncbi:MAG TPA: hypothetical protein VNI57_10225 [Candidatus Saccharimonadales bacterium]|nr:hypothetical protein [Candidatus Saccharimonadales bacterium]
MERKGPFTTRPAAMGRRGPAARVVRTSQAEAGVPAEVVDMLGSMTDREDLARLHARNVDLPTIVRLMGRGVPRDAIRSILESPDPARKIRRILD